MKTYVIPLIVSAIALVVYFSASESIVIIPDESESTQCDIPNLDELTEPRFGTGGPNDGKPRITSFGHLFSIYSSDIGIKSFERLDEHHGLSMSFLPNSYGYVVMCDPLPNLQKLYGDENISDFVILVDGEEIGYDVVENVLKINVNNNTRIELVGFSQR